MSDAALEPACAGCREPRGTCFPGPCKIYVAFRDRLREKPSRITVLDEVPFTVGKAHLKDIELALEQAQACILGDTPEVGTQEDARRDTLAKVREALTNHIPSVRVRLQ